MSLVDAFLMSSAIKEQARNQPSKVPSYITAGGRAAFKALCDDYRAVVNENVGYMFLVLDRELYSPGQTITGHIFFEVFMPCFQNRLVLTFEGEESFPREHLDHVLGEADDAISEEDFAMREQLLSRVHRKGKLTKLELALLTQVVDSVRDTALPKSALA